MDPSLRLSCEELLAFPYFQDEAANWGREIERPGRRHDKVCRRRQAGVNMELSVLNFTTLITLCLQFRRQQRNANIWDLSLTKVQIWLLFLFLLVSVSPCRHSTCPSYHTATSHQHRMWRNRWSINITCPIFNDAENCYTVFCLQSWEVVFFFVKFRENPFPYIAVCSSCVKKQRNSILTNV